MARYLLFAGNALYLFGELCQVIEAKGKYEAIGLARALDQTPILKIFAETEWKEWKRKGHSAICYRDMLVHHGRPWLFFIGEEFDGEPRILLPAYRPKKEIYETWLEQVERFEKSSSQFKPLTEVCAETAHLDRDDIVEVLNGPSRRVRHARPAGCSRLHNFAQQLN